MEGEDAAARGLFTFPLILKTSCIRNYPFARPLPAPTHVLLVFLVVGRDPGVERIPDALVFLLFWRGWDEGQ